MQGRLCNRPAECDVDVPPEHCLYHDGVTGVRELGFLHGVGAYVSGIIGANVAILLDGKIGQARFIFADDFRFAVCTVTEGTAGPSLGSG